MTLERVKRNPNEKFDRGDLEDELKASGLNKRIAEEVSDNVKRKADNWTFEEGRQEAVRELKLLVESTQQAISRFETMTQTEGTTKEYAERVQ